MYKSIILFSLLIFSVRLSGQTVSLAKVEQEMRAYANNGEVKKQSVDLNGDRKDDMIYTCSCGEMRCIRVFLQTAGEYVEVIHTGYSSFVLQTGSGENRKLQLTENSCCGESPFTSYRTFVFEETAARPVENYIVTGEEYTEGRKTVPSSLMDKPYGIKTLTGCNLRFSPDMEFFKNAADIAFTLGTHTNIIATLKAESRLKVLSELPSQGRTWLYVEVEKESIENSLITDFDAISTFSDHRHPPVRGWISSRYVEREQ